MSPDPAAADPPASLHPQPTGTLHWALHPETGRPVAGDRVRATYPGGRTLEGIWSPAGSGLDGFGLHGDDGHLHIHATGPVHCQVVNGAGAPATERSCARPAKQDGVGTAGAS